MPIDPFLGELMLISWNYPPKNWQLCNGQTLPINQNQALFSLLGTMYGGNGQTTFGLPDLRGRVPIHLGNGFTQGQRAGQEAHTLAIAEMPAHTHFLSASPSVPNTPVPTDHLLAGANNAYAPFGSALTTIRPDAVANFGGSQPHNNLQPYLVLNWCVALVGVFPSRN
jgi:microcystin-dependent protein